MVSASSPPVPTSGGATLFHPQYRHERPDVPYQQIRTGRRGGRSAGAGLAGGDVQGDEGALALAEHGELPDHAPRDDVEVVVTVVLAFVRQVVFPNHDAVLPGFFPGGAPGRLAAPALAQVHGDCGRAGTR